MSQIIEKKQNTSSVKPTLFVVLHDNFVKFFDLEPFSVFTSASPRSFLRVAGCLVDQSSLSRNLKVKPLIGAGRARSRRMSLPMSILFSSEAGSLLFRIYSKVSALTVGAGAQRAQVDNRSCRNSMSSRLRGSLTLRICIQCKPFNGLASYRLKNFASCLSVACSPETNCCGTAASYQIKN